MRLVIALCLALLAAAGRAHAGPAASAAQPTVAAYECPMHCEGAKTYGGARSCPVCGMALSQVGGERYRVEVTPAGTIEPGVETALTIRIRDPQGAAVTGLEIVHEKLVHLLIVSSDLSWFAHEHPDRRPDGSFTLRTTFPAPGTYTLFHDFTPPRVGMQVVPVELTVVGTPPPPVALVPDTAHTKTVDGLTARLTPSEPLVAGTNLALTVSLARDGAPVTDLEPFLGAMGHLIIVRADRARFVHSHPVERRGAAPARGPDVRFQCQFPAAGVYKAWAQFQHAGRVVTVPFTLRVGNRNGATAR
jgi:hypothetical protein